MAEMRTAAGEQEAGINNAGAKLPVLRPYITPSCAEQRLSLEALISEFGQLLIRYHMLPGLQDFGYSAFYTPAIRRPTRDQIRHRLSTICYRKTFTGFPAIDFRKLGLGVL